MWSNIKFNAFYVLYVHSFHTTKECRDNNMYKAFILPHLGNWQILKNHEYNPDVPGDDSDTTGIENNFLKFHKQHYLILIVKWILINLYGRKSGYLNTQLSKTQLQNKRKYCHDYLKALNIVDAGISHNRGNIEDEF